MVEHGVLQHIAEIGLAIKKNWYWLLTILPVVFYSMRWAIAKKLDGDYMSRSEIIQRIDQAETTFSNKLDDHERREFERQDKFDRENKDAHNTLGDKIDNLTNVIIDSLRKK